MCIIFKFAAKVLLFLHMCKFFTTFAPDLRKYHNKHHISALSDSCELDGRKHL